MLITDPVQVERKDPAASIRQRREAVVPVSRSPPERGWKSCVSAGLRLTRRWPKPGNLACASPVHRGCAGEPCCSSMSPTVERSPSGAAPQRICPAQIGKQACNGAAGHFWLRASVPAGAGNMPESTSGSIVPGSLCPGDQLPWRGSVCPALMSRTRRRRTQLLELGQSHPRCRLHASELASPRPNTRRMEPDFSALTTAELSLRRSNGFGEAMMARSA